MGKRLFLLVTAILVGVAWTPEFLTAEDATGAKAPEFHAVGAVVGPESKAVADVAWAVSETEATPIAYVPQMTNYTVTSYSGAVVQTPSYNDIYKTGQLVYGHNSWNLMGSLSSLSEGTVFTVTEGGSTQTYRVAKVVLFEKNQETNELQIGGYGNYMGAVTRAVYNGEYFELALMTCAGDPIPDKPGDASHRLVVYANAV